MNLKSEIGQFGLSGRVGGSASRRGAPASTFTASKPPTLTIRPNPPISGLRFTLAASPLGGVPVKVNLGSESGRFGLIVRVGGKRRFTLTDPPKGLADKVNLRSEIGRFGLIERVGGSDWQWRARVEGT